MYRVDGFAFFHVDALRERAGRYDVAIACEVIEHWIHPRAEFRRIADALRADGPRIFAGTTNMRPDGGTIDDGGVGYMSYWSHQSCWNMRALARLAADAGMEHGDPYSMDHPGVLTGDTRKRLFVIGGHALTALRLRARLGGASHFDSRTYLPDRYASHVSSLPPTHRRRPSQAA